MTYGSTSIYNKELLSKMPTNLMFILVLQIWQHTVCSNYQMSTVRVWQAAIKPEC